MTDDEIRCIADDNDSGRTTSGRRLFSDRNLLLFARAIEQASRRAALEEATDLCQAIANGFVSDVNPDYSPEAAKGAKLCVQLIGSRISPKSP